MKKQALLIAFLLGLTTIVAQNPVGIFEDHSDIGAVLHPGTADFDKSSNTYTLTGAGENIWFKKDELHMTTLKMTGDFILTTQPTLEGTGVNLHRKSGWMIRKSLDTSSAMVCLTVHGDGLTAFQYRKTDNSNVEEIKIPILGADILQLERRGRSYFISVAKLGNPFWSVEVPDFSFPQELIVGLFICSHNKDVVEKATFKNTRIFKALAQQPRHVFVQDSAKIENKANSLLNPKGLKDYYKNYFPIGVAVNPRMMEAGAEADLIKAQFSSMTPENAMKMGPIHPEENRYNWEPADKISDFAQKNGLLLRGHTLCWHNQTPNWFFKNGDKTVTKEELLTRLKTHITDVVTRYKGKIYAWDVVNEAVPDGSDKIYRESEFYKIIGEEYIERAFEYAHAADPNAKLFYNDYNTENASKRERIYQLLKKLKAKGMPIHGVGLQGHWSIFEPTAAELEESINKFASLGLEIQFTEVDVSVHSKQHERSTEPFKGISEFTAEMEAKQMAQYKMLFEVFRKHKDQITGITFWNLSDKSSWLDNFPIKGRKDFPLLFDKDFKPKKAYWGVVKF